MFLISIFIIVLYTNFLQKCKRAQGRYSDIQSFQNFVLIKTNEHAHCKDFV